ncbi:1-(5-phosphoribosyl)-5-[(5-phosphoribosylamino)methylideneamino]imidazole-4-carboxamide isomerase [Taibaiella koreensis]|uniref:1-(5-phosphoribosyl)-5-[(5- phosphoribosylamino)methylideneamino]imidazole-4- carboxamide isomerase n=1 Tax=Taibaiella koreensis TaxID=1268548 RepID=UPI000E59C9CA|nr:1-(5-phosphoribosyl)-5-[(5-phosphoribosylamino)methylideneamino]imidazole-4-carboxamide isomerase [Taibaiella koreensis]
MILIPALDIMDGRCVRLSQGDYALQKIYSADPLEVAKSFEAHGLTRLHLVDLDGARSRHAVNYKVLEQITRHTHLAVDFSGGLKTAEALRMAFDCGAAYVVIGSMAAEAPERFLEWLSTYGPERVWLSADCRQRKIATQGWLTTTDTDVVDFLSAYSKQGVQTAICTDIGKDGMLEGPSTGLYEEIINQAGLALIASGGIASLADLAVLKAAGCAGAIIGKALYEGNITLKELESLC